MIKYHLDLQMINSEKLFNLCKTLDEIDKANENSNNSKLEQLSNNFKELQVILEQEMYKSE